jgi:hypothetical protein
MSWAAAGRPLSHCPLGLRHPLTSSLTHTQHRASGEQVLRGPARTGAYVGALVREQEGATRDAGCGGREWGGGGYVESSRQCTPPPPHTHTPRPSPHPARPVCACASEAHARCVLPVESAALHARAGAIAVGAAFHFVGFHLPRVGVPANGRWVARLRRRCRGPPPPRWHLFRPPAVPWRLPWRARGRGRMAWRPTARSAALRLNTPTPRSPNSATVALPPTLSAFTPATLPSSHPSFGSAQRHAAPHRRGRPPPTALPPRPHCPRAPSCTHVPAQGSTRMPHSQLPCRDAFQQATGR